MWSGLPLLIMLNHDYVLQYHIDPDGEVANYGKDTYFYSPADINVLSHYWCVMSLYNLFSANMIYFN